MVPPNKAEWKKTVELDLSAAGTRNELKPLIEQSGLEVKGYVNWFALRWPGFSFIGGMAMGNESKDLEFFYTKPFRYWKSAFNLVVDGGGDIYGVRVKYRGVGGPPDIDCQPPGVHKEGYARSVGPGIVEGGRSYLFSLRCGDMAKQGYCPSYILANGRRIWDSKVHPWSGQMIYVPFWNDADCDEMVIDLVIDKAHTPDAKGLAFRDGHLQYLGRPGCKVSLPAAAEQVEGSPAERVERFTFGLFPCGYDYWTTEGPKIEEIRKRWKPNFKPDYPVDEVWLSPMIFRWLAEGPYHDFMVTYGGCNILGCNPPADILKQAGYVRGVLGQSVEAAKAIFALDPSYQVHWMGGEHGVLWAFHTETGKLVRHDNEAEDVERMAASREKIAANKQATGQPDRVVSIYEPFPPALTHALEYERGNDVLVLKNEEDPQYNILMSMSRGAGRTYGKPFGFYWEQSHYPYPSMDEKLHCCMLFFLSGGSWIGAEMEWADGFNKGVVSDWVLPFVQAQRFAMFHPARGEPVVPVGILWGRGDRWWIPYNAVGHMDTFQRYLEYDHASGTMKCEPAFIKPLHYTPDDRSKWDFMNTGHLNYFYGFEDELKGYDLLDVFFPKYGDAFTARIARLLTGTPYGPVDFVYSERASAEHLASFGMLAVLGRVEMSAELAEKLTAALEASVPVVLGAQHFRDREGKPVSAWGLSIDADPAAVTGAVSAEKDLPVEAGASFDGKVYGFTGDGWETVASVAGKPLLIRKTIGKAPVYVYLGEWMHQGGDVLRPLLSALGERAAPLRFAPADDQMEYVAYRKGAGAWAAMFNHGGIPIGCDRLKELRATPPEPLVSKVKGPWKGQVEFRLERLGLDPKGRYSLYEVEGIDGEAFEGVISGHETFKVKAIDSKQTDGVITAKVNFAKRGQYVIAPKGQGEAVFFGKP